MGKILTVDNLWKRNNLILGWCCMCKSSGNMLSNCYSIVQWHCAWYVGVLARKTIEEYLELRVLIIYQTFFVEVLVWLDVRIGQHSPIVFYWFLSFWTWDCNSLGVVWYTFCVCEPFFFLINKIISILKKKESIVYIVEEC